jgi:hypothetical protein
MLLNSMLRESVDEVAKRPDVRGSPGFGSGTFLSIWPSSAQRNARQFRACRAYFRRGSDAHPPLLVSLPDNCIPGKIQVVLAENLVPGKSRVLRFSMRGSDSDHEDA